MLTNHERIELYELRAMAERIAESPAKPVAEVIRHNAPHIEPACFRWLDDNAKTIAHGAKLFAMPPVTDDLLVELFYAAQGDITKFRIKARALLGA